MKNVRKECHQRVFQMRQMNKYEIGFWGKLRSILLSRDEKAEHKQNIL